MRMDCVGVRVRWRMYGVGVCVAAKVRMIPLPICDDKQLYPLQDLSREFCSSHLLFCEKNCYSSETY